MFVLKSEAQNKDSLPEIILNSKKSISTTDETVPIFQLRKKILSNLNSNSVADALKYIPGVLVKDYGGIGGLKTVSIRSLGANHTGVLYDGLSISNSSSGIIDLGKISLDNIESLTLYQSQPLTILMPARSFASASIISINSQSQNIDSSKKISGDASVNFGSFGLMGASAYIKRSLAKNWFTNISANLQKSRGNYSFKSYVNINETLKRENTDLNSFRFELNLAKLKLNDDKIKLKAFYYQSNRGLPGSVIYYNNISNQRLIEKNTFLQGSWNISLNKKSKILFSGKLSYDLSDYTDPDFQNSMGGIQNTFHQREAYASSAYSYKISKRLTGAYAADIFITNLKRTDKFSNDFQDPSRLTFLNNLSFYADYNSFKISGNILSTYFKDYLKNEVEKVSASEVSPAISAIWQPVEKLPLKIRAFYKNIFRAPTFNDLYYTNVGNTNLKPEYVNEFNSGITFNPSLKQFKNLEFSVDGYLNKIHDKIIAVPRQNLFQWTMLNIGEVEIHGIDISTRFSLKEINKISFSGMVSYTYQQALDVSSKTSNLYKTQLPYVPKHSGSAHLNAEIKRFSFSYNILFSGDRYRLGEPIIDNRVAGFGIQDFSMSFYSFFKGHKYIITSMLNNISNNNYEVIKYYPMPGFNYRLCLTVSL